MKKLLVSLLCAVMMVTFMPSMAFAATGDAGLENQKITTEAALEKAINDNAKEISIGDIKLTKPLKIDANKNITISGGSITPGEGFSTDNSQNAVIHVNGGTLTLNGTKVDADGKSRVIYANAGKLVVNEGTVITGGKITDSYIAGIYMTAQSEFEMNGGTISGNTVAGQYADHPQLKYADDLWIGANAKGTIRGGSIENALVNANEYSGDTRGNFSVNGGSIDCVFVETDQNFDADFKLLESGNVGTVIVKSGVTFKSLVESTGGTVGTVKLAESITLRGEESINFNRPVKVTADEGKNITLSKATVNINADTEFSGFKVTTAIVNDSKTALSKIVVADGKTLKISNNSNNGMNGGILTVNGGTVIAEGNGDNGITAKVEAKGNAVITATGNGKNGLTLNGGSQISDTAKMTATGNNSGNKDGHDIEINTNGSQPGLETVTIAGNASVTAGTMAGHAVNDTVAGRDKVVIVEGNGVTIDVLNPVTNSKNSQNNTSELFKQAENLEEDGSPADTTVSDTTKKGVVILGDKATVHGEVNEVKLDRPVEVTVVKGAKVDKINAPAGTTVTNKSDKPVEVVTPNGIVTVKPNDTVTSYPQYIPPTPTTQKPILEHDATVKVELSAYGTIATITVADGYELADVVLNGKSLGKVTTVTDLKTGDKLVITTVKKPAEFDVNAALDGLKLTARSSKTSKKNIKVVVKMDDQLKAAVEELKANGYTVKYKFYRSVKKASKYTGKLTKSDAVYTNTAGKKGTMYYYKARLQVYDAAGKLVDRTELKQCRYANRLWTK